MVDAVRCHQGRLGGLVYVLGHQVPAREVPENCGTPLACVTAYTGRHRMKYGD